MLATVAVLAEAVTPAAWNGGVGMRYLKRRGIALILAGMLVSPGLAQTRPAPAPAPPAGASGPIDINSASRDDLMTLEGIGEVRADAIIRARPFRVKGDLVERRIVPEALYDKIADQVVVRGVPAPAQTTPAPKRR